VRTPERYIRAVAQGESTEAAGETLDEATRQRERLELMLRMRDGIDARHLPVEGLEDLVTVRNGRARLTRQGRLLANEVSLKIIP
jgi:coproporphyrinogen III oxidase-like Fe-S oxidoreductase